jgi:hypothetical protein
MVWYGMVWYDMVWYGMVWYGMVWYGMVGSTQLCQSPGGGIYRRGGVCVGAARCRDRRGVLGRTQHCKQVRAEPGGDSRRRLAETGGLARRLRRRGRQAALAGSYKEPGAAGDIPGGCRVHGRNCRKALGWCKREPWVGGLRPGQAGPGPHPPQGMTNCQSRQEPREGLRADRQAGRQAGTTLVRGCGGDLRGVGP